MRNLKRELRINYFLHYQLNFITVMIRIINKMFFSCLSGVLLFETFMRMIKIFRICHVSFSCCLQTGGHTAMDIGGKKPDQEFGSTSASVK